MGISKSILLFKLFKSNNSKVSATIEIGESLTNLAFSSSLRGGNLLIFVFLNNFNF
jgi:hypothetical protein